MNYNNKYPKKSFLYFIFVFLINLYFSKTEILFVFEHFRHGARSSVFIDKKHMDKYDIPWIGDGELTAIGMRMHYLIGVFIRNKYNNIINNNTDPKDILVFSTDLNRTIVSAKAQLLGMFPIGKGLELTNSDLKIIKMPKDMPVEGIEEIKKLKNISSPTTPIVIPIRFFDERKKYLLTEATDCPKSTFVKKNNYKKNKHLQFFIDDFIAKYGNKLIKYFELNDTTILRDYYFLLGVTDHFISNYIHKRHLLSSFENSGINLQEFFDDCVLFKNITIFEIDTGFELGIIAASPIMSNLILFMDRIIEKKPSPKFLMYSGHDYIIAAVELFLNKAFGINCYYPDFAANQFFELHSDEKNKNYTVKYFYDGKLLLDIDYLEFKKKINKIVWSQEEITRFCKVEEKNIVDYTLYITLVICSLGIIIIMIRENLNKKKKERQL